MLLRPSWMNLAKPTSMPEQYVLLKRVLATFVHVMGSLQSAKASMKRLQHMQCGQRTEHERHVLGALTMAGGSHTPDRRAGTEPGRGVDAAASAATGGPCPNR